MIAEKRSDRLCAWILTIEKLFIIIRAQQRLEQRLFPERLLREESSLTMFRNHRLFLTLRLQNIDLEMT